ncbi:hypothetical protein [Amycolatopsis albispora]|uniref:Secreted protein n=1 Tax=Amycolatopsis albispora TaxID=1804986 RepID=A0A344L1B5_9PSEU|nr:hypothetical protein [Amycolatopsis albispora]AXB41839.1 hypothetical protein A4R43_04265 [Amycolatopsis albispora]
MASTKWNRVVATVAATSAVMGLGLLAPGVASAASFKVDGHATTGIKHANVNITQVRTGDIAINYTNGIGWGGNQVLFLRLVHCNSKKPFADTRVIQGHGTYNLGRSVKKNTCFDIEYRAEKDPAPNPYWAGTVSIP